MFSLRYHKLSVNDQTVHTTDISAIQGMVTSIQYFTNVSVINIIVAFVVHPSCS